MTLLPKNNPYISRENARELEERLASMGATLLIDTLKSIETGNATYTKQDEKEVTFAPKLKKENGLITWSQETQKIHNLIRGVTPSPGAYTYYCTKDTEEKKRLIILKTQIHETSKTKTSLNPGTVVEIAPCGIHVVTLDGFLCITRLQPEGKRAMDAHEYTRGHKVVTHDMFIS